MSPGSPSPLTGSDTERAISSPRNLSAGLLAAFAGIANRLASIGVDGTRRASLQSLGSGLVGQVSLILSGVLLARILGPEQRGYIALLALWPAVISRVGELGLASAATYYIAREPSSFRHVMDALRRLAIRQVPLLIACHAVILTAYLIGKPSAVIIAGVLTLVSVPAAIAADYGMAMLQGQHRFGALNLLRNLNQAVVVTGLIFLVVIHWTSLVAATCVVIVALFASGLAFLAAALRFDDGGRGGSLVSSGQLLRFGLHGLLGSLYPLETFRIDQLVVGLLLSPAALGFYVVGLAFTNIPLFTAQSLGYIAYPAVASDRDLTRRRRTIWMYFWLVLGLSIVPVIVLELSMGALLPWFFGRQFEPSVAIGRIMMIGGLILAGRRILAEGLRGAGYPAAGTIAEGGLLAVLLPGMVLGSHYWGAEGVAGAVALSALVGLLVMIGLEARANRPGANARPTTDVRD